MDIFFVILICLRVSGNVSTLINTVKTSILIPKLENRTAYSSIRLFIIGPSITWFQINPRNSKVMHLAV